MKNSTVESVCVWEEEEVGIINSSMCGVNSAGFSDGCKVAHPQGYNLSQRALSSPEVIAYSQSSPIQIKYI